MRLFIVVSLSFIFVVSTTSDCRPGKNDSLKINNGSEPNYENTSLGFYFPTNYRAAFAAGYSANDNMKLSSYSEKFFVNISYSISNFYFPLDYSPSQVGLYNEIGIYNTSLYLNIGPELRLEKHFYLIPYVGISIIPFSKFNNEDLAFVYYLGASAGYIINLNEEIDLILEASSDYIKFNKDQNNYYFKIGVCYNLYYPL